MTQRLKAWLRSRDAVAVLAAGLVVGALFNVAFHAAPWDPEGLAGGLAAALLLRGLA